MENIQYKQLTNASHFWVTRLRDMLNEYVSFGLATNDSVIDLIQNHKVYTATTYTEDNQVLLVGTLTLKYSENYTEIVHVVTHPDFRRRGIASQLMTLALHHYNEGLPLRAIGWVKPHGWEAESIFLNQGFNVVGENDSCWGKTCTSVENCPHYTSKCNCSTKYVVRE